jgi:D-glycero-beta-D-manno-heptose 1-phosphate adenylyltransferase
MNRRRQLMWRGGNASRARNTADPYLVSAMPFPGVPGLSANLFADASNFELRFVEDYEQIETTVRALRTLNFRVVLTSGSFDIIHEGHSMYLEAARRYGDFLIVGLDSDDKIRARKGPDRPAVPEMERLRMVTHQRGVGLVTLKHLHHARWHLIKTVKPDVLVATEETYTSTEIRELEARYCGKVQVLERMATVSTSARLRRIQLGISEADPAEPVDGGTSYDRANSLTPACGTRN